MATTRTCDECGKALGRSSIGDGDLMVTAHLKNTGRAFVILRFGYGRARFSARVNAKQIDVCPECLRKAELYVEVWPEEEK